MPSFKDKVSNLQCILKVHIGPDSEVDRGITATTLLMDPPFPKFEALIDTGAQRTCLTKNVAEKLALVSRGKSQMASASEVTSVNHYYIDLIIPIVEIQQDTEQRKSAVRISAKHHKKLLVSEITALPERFDVLLCMDLLIQCNFILAHGEYILSY